MQHETVHDRGCSDDRGVARLERDQGSFAEAVSLAHRYLAVAQRGAVALAADVDLDLPPRDQVERVPCGPRVQSGA